MVIVRHSRFEQRGASGGLDLPREPRTAQDRQRVIDRLDRYGLQARHRRLHDLFGRQVLSPLAQHIQHRQPLGGHSKPGDLQLASEIGRRRHLNKNNSKNGYIPMLGELDAASESHGVRPAG